MRRGVWLYAAVALFTTLGAQAQTPAWGLKVTGLMGTPVAGGDEPSVRGTIEPSVKWMGTDLELRGRARLRWLDLDASGRHDADVRELTLAWRRDDTTLTLGAQQLNWGRMDILRVTDVINPVDQHDLFHEELPEAKLALWMANLEWQSGAQTLQLVLTPQVPVDRLPRGLDGLPVSVTQPSDSWRNATAAVRYGVEAFGWNADAMASRGWHSTPTLRPVVDAAGPRLQGFMSRQDSLGFSADRPIGGTVLRLEGLAARVFPDDGAAAPGASTRRQVVLGSGLDARAGDWFFAGQIIGQQDRDTVTGRSGNAFVSLIVQRKWMQDRLAARALHIRERGSSSWTSLRASYELSPRQVLQVQGDWFKGGSTQPFGSFTPRSRIATSVRLDF